MVKEEAGDHHRSYRIAKVQVVDIDINTSRPNDAFMRK